MTGATSDRSHDVHVEGKKLQKEQPESGPEVKTSSSTVLSRSIGKSTVNRRLAQSYVVVVGGRVWM